MDPEGSVSCPQQPITAPYPQPDEPNVNLHILFPEHPLQYYPLIFLQVFLSKPCMHFPYQNH